jgi:hypothetical protein
MFGHPTRLTNEPESHPTTPDSGTHRRKSVAVHACAHRRLPTRPTQETRQRLLVPAQCNTMVQFLWQDGLVSVAHFVADCFDHFQGGGDPSIQP